MKIAVRLVLVVSGLVATSVSAWTLVNSSGQGWASPNIVLHWNFDLCDVEEADMLARLDQAIGVWNAGSGSALQLSRSTTASADTAATFVAGTATEVPLIVCDNAFATNNSVDADFIPAATRLAMPGGQISYGGILLNADAGAAANLQNLSADQISVVLAHEIGHVVGLGHSSVVDALMYYSIDDKTVPIVTEDDLDALAFLYPRNEFSGAPFGCASVSQGDRNVPVRATQAAAYLFLLIGLSLAVGRLTARYYQT